jgi:hypothetical protein
MSRSHLELDLVLGGMSLWSTRSCGEAIAVVDASGEYESVALNRMVITRSIRSNKVRVRYSVMVCKGAGDYV